MKIEKRKKTPKTNPWDFPLRGLEEEKENNGDQKSVICEIVGTPRFFVVVILET